MRLSVYDRPQIKGLYEHNVKVDGKKLTRCVVADSDKGECVVYADEPVLVDMGLESYEIKPPGWWPAGARTSGGKMFAVIKGDVFIYVSKVEYRDMPPGVPLSGPTTIWTYEEGKAAVETTVIERNVSAEDWARYEGALEDAGFLTMRKVDELLEEMG